MVVLHADNVAHLDFVPALLHRLAVAQDVRLSVVDLRVASMSLLQSTNTRQKNNRLGSLNTQTKTRATHKIVVGIFDGRKEEDTDERHGSGDWRQGRDERDELQYQKAQEIEIGQPLELLDQVHRHKRQQRVLGRLDVVVLHKTPQHKRQTVYD